MRGARWRLAPLCTRHLCRAVTRSRRVSASGLVTQTVGAHAPPPPRERERERKRNGGCFGAKFESNQPKKQNKKTVCMQAAKKLSLCTSTSLCLCGSPMSHQRTGRPTRLSPFSLRSTVAFQQPNTDAETVVNLHARMLSLSLCPLFSGCGADNLFFSVSVCLAFSTLRAESGQMPLVNAFVLLIVTHKARASSGPPIHPSNPSVEPLSRC